MYFGIRGFYMYIYLIYLDTFKLQKVNILKGHNCDQKCLVSETHFIYLRKKCTWMYIHDRSTMESIMYAKFLLLD